MNQLWFCLRLCQKDRLIIKIKLIEFFLNDFHWIQWIKSKSKSGMVTRDTPYLITDTFLNIVFFFSLNIVVKKILPLLSLGWYLFTVARHNGYLTRGSNGNTHYITMSGNVSVASWVTPLAIIPFLDFFMIQWIRWISEIHLGTLMSFLLWPYVPYVFLMISSDIFHSVTYRLSVFLIKHSHTQIISDKSSSRMNFESAYYGVAHCAMTPTLDLAILP